EVARRRTRAGADPLWLAGARVWMYSSCDLRLTVTVRVAHRRSRDGLHFGKESSMRDPGGTPGGMGTFLFGGAMTIAGGYLLLQQVTVTGGSWNMWGYNAFGLSLVPLLIGIGCL